MANDDGDANAQSLVWAVANSGMYTIATRKVHHPPFTEGSSYRYYLEIRCYNNRSYIIYAPIAINTTDNGTSITMSNLKILEGECSIEFIEAKYGKTLRITGKGNVTLESMGNTKEKIDEVFFSMSNETFHEGIIYHQIYLNSSRNCNNCNISLYINCRTYWGTSYGTGYSYRAGSEYIFERLKEGWNLYQGHWSYITLDNKFGYCKLMRGKPLNVPSSEVAVYV